MKFTEVPYYLLKRFLINTPNVLNTEYTITTTVTGACSITPENPSIYYGQNITLTIEPEAGYTVTSVYVDDTNKGSITTYTFSNVTTNHTVTVYGAYE